MARAGAIIVHTKTKQPLKPTERHTDAHVVRRHARERVRTSGKNGRELVLPPSGPSNIIVRTPSPLSPPKDVDSQ